MVYGYLDTRHIDFPQSIDPTYLASLQNARGVSFQSVLQQLDARLAAAGRTFDPLVASLIALSSDPVAETQAGGAFRAEEEPEYGVVAPQFIEPAGHLNPIRRFQFNLGFTEDALEDMTERQILRQGDGVLRGVTRNQRVRALTRLFSADEVRVDRKSTAVSPGFAGSGTGTNVFGQPYPDGTDTGAGYTHYVRDTQANLITRLVTERNRLAKWHPGPYDLATSGVMLDLIMADARFVKATPDLILRAQGDAAANVDPAQFVGVFDGDVRVWKAINELGTEPNIALFKSYGVNDARNPLVYRYDERFGRAPVIRFRSMYPLDNAIIRHRFDVGVHGDRVGAVLIRIAGSGAYVAPTLQ
jgi:hypothetical protein